VALPAGLALALGAGQVPAHFHLLQTLVLYLPLVAATITRLRNRPTAWRALATAVACLLAFFSSYYTAVLAGVVAGVWIALEACRPLEHRARFIVLVSMAVIAAGVLLVLFSLPYAQRPEAATELSSSGSPEYDRGILLLALYYPPAPARCCACSRPSDCWAWRPATRPARWHGAGCCSR
jgi:hypothetical protein